MLLSSPALYRAALPLADSALRHLPKLVIHNRLNTWGRGRDVPHPDSHPQQASGSTKRHIARRSASTTSCNALARGKDGVPHLGKGVETRIAIQVSAS